MTIQVQGFFSSPFVPLPFISRGQGIHENSVGSVGDTVRALVFCSLWLSRGSGFPLVLAAVTGGLLSGRGGVPGALSVGSAMIPVPTTVSGAWQELCECLLSDAVCQTTM